MKIRTRQQVHGRTAGGHIYSAGEGTESVIDDANTDMVELVRLMASRGQVEILEDVAAPAEEPDAAKATPAKKTTARRASGAK